MDPEVFFFGSFAFAVVVAGALLAEVACAVFAAGFAVAEVAAVALAEGVLLMVIVLFLLIHCGKATGRGDGLGVNSCGGVSDEVLRVQIVTRAVTLPPVIQRGVRALGGDGPCVRRGIPVVGHAINNLSCPVRGQVAPSGRSPGKTTKCQTRNREEERQSDVRNLG